VTGDTPLAVHRAAGVDRLDGRLHRILKARGGGQPPRPVAFFDVGPAGGDERARGDERDERSRRVFGYRARFRASARRRST
jgi:hypothetical protein